MMGGVGLSEGRREGKGVAGEMGIEQSDKEG